MGAAQLGRTGILVFAMLYLLSYRSDVTTSALHTLCNMSQPHFSFQLEPHYQSMLDPVTTTEQTLSSRARYRASA